MSDPRLWISLQQLVFILSLSICTSFIIFYSTPLSTTASENSDFPGLGRTWPRKVFKSMLHGALPANSHYLCWSLSSIFSVFLKVSETRLIWIYCSRFIMSFSAVLTLLLWVKIICNDWETVFVMSFFHYINHSGECQDTV